MVTIKLFGLTRETGGRDKLIVKAGTVRGAMEQAAAMGVDPKLFRRALLFVNNRQLRGAGRFAFRLQDGDELALLSPVGGG